MELDAFGISGIGAYLPALRQDNIPVAETFAFPEEFLRSKIGVLQPARKGDDEETSDLCVGAFQDLTSHMAIDAKEFDAVVVVTQNPDGHGLPHTSAIVHKKLQLPLKCFAFDVSLGCSGYVAGLAILKGYLQSTAGRRGILFTADPYSKVLDKDDRNTVLIFGDGATATVIERTRTWCIGSFDMGTDGRKWEALKVCNDGKLSMNGKAVFDFCAINIPNSVRRALQANDLAKEEVNRFVLHPGSKYIVDVLADRIGIAPIPFPATYGNTVSSSLPLILRELDPATDRTVLISGFGVGLGWATTILRSR